MGACLVYKNKNNMIVYLLFAKHFLWCGNQNMNLDFVNGTNADDDGPLKKLVCCRWQ